MERYQNMTIALDQDLINELQHRDVLETADYMWLLPTPDNVYVILKWDLADIETEDMTALRYELEHMRHAMLTVSESGEVFLNTEISDKFGTDQEFEDIIKPVTYPAIWGNPRDLVLTPSEQLEIYFPGCIKDAEQCLIDNGIDENEAQTVLQALGYILLNTELYPHAT